MNIAEHQLKHNLIEYTARHIMEEADSGCCVGYFVNTHDNAYNEVAENDFYYIKGRKICVIALNSVLGYTAYRFIEYDGHARTAKEVGRMYL